jgi:flagellar motility protein MotE (MotC chaperone)
MFRRLVQTALAVGAFVNVLLLIDALSVNWLVPHALAEEVAAPDTNPASAPPAVHEQRETPDADTPACEQAELTYRNLVGELTEQRKRLDQETQSLSERERQLSVLTAELEKRDGELDALAKQLEVEKQRLETAAAPSFEKLLKAYEGMDPINAASSLHELVGKDRQTVIDLLLGLKPRQSAAVLDALAAEHPREAADLSYEIWKKQPANKTR